MPELVSMLVSLVLFVLAYVDSGSLKGVARGTVSKLYHIGSLQPDPDIAKVSLPLVRRARRVRLECINASSLF